MSRSRNSGGSSRLGVFLPNRRPRMFTGLPSSDHPNVSSSTYGPHAARLRSLPQYRWDSRGSDIEKRTTQAQSNPLCSRSDLADCRTSSVASSRELPTQPALFYLLPKTNKPVPSGCISLLVRKQSALVDPRAARPRAAKRAGV